MDRSQGQVPELTDEAEAEGQSTPTVNETFWGYVIGPAHGARARARRGETLAVFGALFFCGIAFVPWLLGSNADNSELLPFRIAVTAVFFAIGGLLYLMAKKGMALETQVDLHEKEIRIVRRNRGEESVTLNSFSFDQVAEIDTTRAPGHFLLGNLVVRLRNGSEDVVIASGADSALAAIKEKIMTDMKPEAARTKRPQGFASTMRPETARASVFKRALS